MILDNDQIRRVYRRIAPIYDLTLSGYRFVGLASERQSLVTRLELGPGDTVVDLGCGTGLNLPFLSDAIGPRGRVIGVDLSQAMLERARKKVDRGGWRNVELVRRDLREFRYPRRLNAVLGTFTMEMVPGYGTEIERIAASLATGGKLGLLGLKLPERWPEWLVSLGLLINRPFGVSRDYAGFHPWESVQANMRDVEFREIYLGAAYWCLGTAPYIRPAHRPDVSSPGQPVDAPAAG